MTTEPIIGYIRIDDPNDLHELIRKLPAVEELAVTTNCDEPNVKPCGRCGDTDRHDDGGDSVCSTCGLTRWAGAT